MRRLLSLLCTGALALGLCTSAQAATYRANGHANDGYVTETGTNNGQPLHTGTFAGITIFQLPTLGSGEQISAVDLKLGFYYKNGTPDFNVDIYALRTSDSASYSTDDWYEGANDTSDATKIMDDFVESTDSVGDYTLSTTAQAAFATWLQGHYTGTTPDHPYVILRHNANIDTAQAATIRFNDAEGYDPDRSIPKLIITTGEGSPGGEYTVSSDANDGYFNQYGMISTTGINGKFPANNCAVMVFQKPSTGGATVTSANLAYHYKIQTAGSSDTEIDYLVQSSPVVPSDIFGRSLQSLETVTDWDKTVHGHEAAETSAGDSKLKTLLNSMADGEWLLLRFKLDNQSDPLFPMVAMLENNNFDEGILTFTTDGGDPGGSDALAHWKLDDDTTDSSGNGYNGTRIGNPPYVSGKYGKALSFDGVDDHVLVPDMEIATPPDEVTVMAWINRADDLAKQYLVERGHYCYPFYVWLYNGKLKAEIRTDQGTQLDYIAKSDVLPINSWVHVAMTYASGTIRLYTNGVLADTESGIPGSSLDWGDAGSDDVCIGALNGAEKYFDGQLDDVRIYDTALNQTDIQTAMNNGDPGGTEYSLNVVNGTGDGSYEEDEDVDISATPPAGNHFTYWSTSSGGTFGEVDSANTTYAMPGNNATITANYEADQGGTTEPLNFRVGKSGMITKSLVKDTGNAYCGVISPNEDAQKKAAIFVFKMDSDIEPTNIATANFTAELLDVRSGAAPGDLYVLRVSPKDPDNGAMIDDDWYMGSAEDTRGIAERIKAGFVNDGHGTNVSISTGANSDLGGWLKDNWSDGDFVVLRVNPSADVDGTYKFYRFDESKISLTVTTGDGGGNEPPEVGAGPDKTVTSLTGVSMNGTWLVDDGQPVSASLLWSKLSGPGSVVFNGATDLSPTVDFGQTGIYDLRLTADDTQYTDSDDVRITVTDGGGTTDHIIQDSITWYFDREYTVGTFGSGDPWVVGPVTITSIDPPIEEDMHSGLRWLRENSQTRYMHGSMVNPDIGLLQGYDSGVYGPYSYNMSVDFRDHDSNPATAARTVPLSRRTNPDQYDPNLNVALQLPNLVLGPGSSLISTKSFTVDDVDNDGNGKPTYERRPILQAASVLTVLSAPPAEGSFRPPYIGSGNKSIQFNKSTVVSRLSLLPDLPVPSGAPNMETITDWFRRPRLEDTIGSETVDPYNTMNRYAHPADNMKDYGGDIAYNVAHAALLLCMDYTDAQKEELAIGITQYGIDLYGLLEEGALWADNGGHHHGRKLAVMLAGYLLGNYQMLHVENYHPLHFQEDLNTFYVPQDYVGMYVGEKDPLHPSYPFINWQYCFEKCEPARVHFEYEQYEVGLPEWGVTHSRSEHKDCRDFFTTYRSLNANPLAGQALVVHILGFTDEWAGNAAGYSFLDYQDRYMQQITRYEGHSQSEKDAIMEPYTDIQSKFVYAPPTAYFKEMWADHRTNYTARPLQTYEDWRYIDWINHNNPSASSYSWRDKGGAHP